MGWGGRLFFKLYFGVGIKLGNDGIPIVFSHEIDPQTLDASDFQIKTQKGDIVGIEHASYRPAVEEFELRTLLLIGEYGNHPDNEPIEVTIVGDVQIIV